MELLEKERKAARDELRHIACEAEHDLMERASEESPWEEEACEEELWELERCDDELICELPSPESTTEGDVADDDWSWWGDDASQASDLPGSDLAPAGLMLLEASPREEALSPAADSLAHCEEPECAVPPLLAAGCGAPSEVPQARRAARAPTRWQLAVALAEGVAAEWGGQAPPGTQGGRRKNRARTAWRRPDPPATPLQLLQREFLKEHGEKLQSKLSPVFNLTSGAVRFTPTPMGQEPARRFMENRNQISKSRLVPVYHGTNVQNYDSIFKSGLLIPGRGNSLRVVNGSAYGVGIYTAPVSNPSLSMSYARGGQRLLVCAYLEGNADAEQKVAIHAPSSAIVIFKPDRVIPLFVASSPSAPLQPSRAVPRPPAPRLRTPPEPPALMGAGRRALKKVRALKRAARAPEVAPAALAAHYSRRAMARRRS